MITLSCSCGQEPPSVKSEPVEELSNDLAGAGGATANAYARFNCQFDEEGKVITTIEARAAAHSGTDRDRIVSSSASTKIEFIKKLKTEGPSGQPGKVLGHLLVGPDRGVEDHTLVNVSFTQGKDTGDAAQWTYAREYAPSGNEEVPIEFQLLLGQEFEFTVAIQISTDIPQWGGQSSGDRNINITFGALTDIGNDPVGIFELPFDGALGATTGT